MKKLMNFFKRNKEKSPDEGNINMESVSRFAMRFGKEATEEALAEVARQKAERDAMPRDKDWLLQECYNHVCWHEGGSSMAMGYYHDQIEKRWRPEMSAAETEALKEELLGY